MIDKRRFLERAAAAAVFSAALPAMSRAAPAATFDVAGNRVVSDVASLKALPAPLGEPADEAVLVLGYRSSGDGGGGIFTWHPRSDAADDGGLVLAPTRGAATGRWLRLRTDSTGFDVRWFGAMGGGEADDRNAINAAIAAAIRTGGGSVVLAPGTYRISDFVGETTKSAETVDIALIGLPGAVLDCRPNGTMNAAVDLTIRGLRTGYVRGLRIQGNGAINSGIVLRSFETTSSELLVVEDCQVHDVRLAAAHEGMGIFVGSGEEGYEAVVRNCVVEKIAKAASTKAPVSGIAVTHFENVAIEGNRIASVSHDRETKLDADGIKVFSKVQQGVYSRSTVRVVGNTVIDCEGRWIKLQTGGRAQVSSNTLRIDSPIELIENFVGVDSQVHSASIVMNSIYVTAPFSGGAAAKLAALQANAKVREPGEASHQSFNFNDVYVLGDRPFRWIVTLRADNRAPATHFMDLIGNRVQGPADIDQFEPRRGVPSETFVGIVNIPNDGTSSTMAAKAYVRIKDNVATCSDFISLTGSTRGTADHKGRLFLEVTGNRCFPAGAGIALFKAQNNRQITSSLTARDNQIGNHQGGTVDWDLDLAYLGGGCDFRAAGAVHFRLDGGHPPPVYRGARIVYAGGQYQVQAGASTWISNDQGATWQVPGALTDATEVWRPGRIQKGARTSRRLSIRGARLGDFVLVSADTDLHALLLSGVVVAPDAVEVTLTNASIGDVDPGDLTVRARVINR